MADFGTALQLLGMGMQGNSQGISDFFAQQKEAERVAKINEIMGGLSGGQGDRVQQLGALAQLDPRTFAAPYINESRPLTPGEEADAQIKRIQLENLQAEQGMRTRRQSAADRLLNRPPQSPNFNPAIPTPAPALSSLSGADDPRQSTQAAIPQYQALQQMAGSIPQADNMNSRGETLGLPMPSAIQSMAQQFGAPVQPVAQEPLAAPVMPSQLPAPMAAPPSQIVQQPAPVQPAPVQAPQLLGVQEWMQTQPGQAALALGDEEALKQYGEYAKAEQENQRKMQEEQQKIQNAAQPVQAAKQVFTGAIEEIKTLYDEMRKEGTLPSADQNIVERGLVGATSAVLDPARRQKLDGLLSRLRLSLIAATGMSSQVFNSNAEMQSLMKALSSPANVYEANVGILNSLSKQYGTGAISEPVDTNRSQPTRLRWNQRTGTVE